MTILLLILLDFWFGRVVVEYGMSHSGRKKFYWGSNTKYDWKLQLLPFAEE